MASMANLAVTVLVCLLAICVFAYRTRLVSLDPSLYKRVIWGAGFLTAARVFNSVPLSGLRQAESALVLRASLLGEFLGYSLAAVFIIRAVSELWSKVPEPAGEEDKDYQWNLFHRAIPNLLPADGDPEKSVGAFLGYLRTSFGYDAVSVHLLDGGGKTLKLWRSVGMEDSWWKLYGQVPVKGSLVGTVIDAGRIVSSEEVKSDPRVKGFLAPFGDLVSFLGCPLRFEKRNLGILSVYSRERRRFERLEIRTLITAVEQLSTVIALADYREKIAEKERSTRLVPGLEQAAVSHSELREGLPRMAAVVRSFVPCDYLSLLLLDRSGQNMWRYTASAKESLLVEKRASPGELGPTLRALMTEKQGRILNDFQSHPGEMRYLPFASETSSLMLLPLTLEETPTSKGGALRGVLICASETPGGYDEESLRLLEAVSAYVAVIAQKDLLQERLDTGQRRTKELTRKVASDFALSDGGKRLGQVAEAVVNGLPATTCRVIGFDSDSSSFKSLGSFDRRRTLQETMISGNIFLSESPLLRRVMVSREPFTLDAASPASHLSEEEHLNIFGGDVRSGLMVPVTSGEEVCGVIAVGERRNPLRRPFSEEEVEFCSVVANRLAPVLSSPPEEEKEESQTRLGEVAMESLPDLVFEMRSPLTAILGNCELMLRTQGPSLAQQTRERISTIQRSGKRLHRSLEKLAGLHSSVIPPGDDRTYDLGG